MAKTDFIETGSEHVTLLQAESNVLRIENSDFITESDMSRDGLDLQLTLESGEVVIVEGYFSVDTPPTLISEGGAALTPKLVNSFTNNFDFAEANGTTDVSPVGAVKEITGDATVTRTNGNVEAVTLGTPIYEGDIIETTEDGAVNIIFIDETEFAVSEDARLAIDEYVFDADTAEGTTSFSVLRGVFVFTSGIIGQEDPDDVEIETPVGSIGIRGTIIAGKISPDGNDTQITVIEGAIVIKNALGETTLSNQFETVKISGFESDIINIGQIDSTQMNQDFGSVSGVSGSLFSAINDAGKSGDAGSNMPEAPQSETEADPIEAQPDNGSEQGLENSSENNQGLDQETIKTGLESSLDNENTKLQSSGNRENVPSSNDTIEQNVKPAKADTQAEAPQVQDSITDLINPDAIRSNAPPSNDFGSGIFNLDDSTVFSSRGFEIGSITNSGAGSSIAAISDIDGDGFSDFVFTGNDGNLYTFTTSSMTLSDFDLRPTVLVGSDVETGLNLSGAADFDADGELDLIVGMPSADISLGGIQGQYTLLTSTNNANNNSVTFDTAFISAAVSELGKSVTVIGDINGDGFSDYAASIDAFAGGDGGVLIKLGSNVSLSAIIDLNNLEYIAGTSGSLLGTSLSAVGDVNRDGFDDLVAGTDNNDAFLIYGNSAGTYATAPALIRPAGVSNFGENVAGGADINRDGFSDFLISSTGIFGDQVHLYTNASTLPSATFSTSRAGWHVNKAEMIGDFNGDGINDFSVSTNNGIDSEIFVIYGNEIGLSGNIDLNFNNLSSFDGQFGNVFSWSNTGSQIELSNVGDVNGDGFYDLGIGATESNGTDGAIRVLFGDATPNVVTDNSAFDVENDIDSMGASQNNQSLVGNQNDNIITGNGHTGLSILAGAGDDRIILDATPGMGSPKHKTIDGGTGIDDFVMSGNNGLLDFSVLGPANDMTISNIENIFMNGNGQTLTFDTRDIFALLQESATNELRITSLGGGNTLNIVKDGADTNFGNAGFTGELGTDTNTNGFYDLDFGNYTVLVDTNITVSLV